MNGYQAEYRYIAPTVFKVAEVTAILYKIWVISFQKARGATCSTFIGITMVSPGASGMLLLPPDRDIGTDGNYS